MNNSKKVDLKIDFSPDSPSERGQAMILAVLFFLFITVALVLALASPLLSHLRASSALLSSFQAFSAAEAGMEDAVYRFKHGMNVSSVIELVIGEAIVTTTHQLDEEVEIVSEAVAAGDSVRRDRVRLRVGDGIAFNYGVQTGTGGFEIRNATVNGSIFSMGNITGTHSGATVTGSAIAANTPESTPATANQMPIPPSKFIVFGMEEERRDAAQSFQLSQAGTLSKLELYLRKVGTPASITVRIVEDWMGNPSDDGQAVLAQTVLRSRWVTDQYGWIELYFPSTTELEADTVYWIVLEAETHSGRYYQWASNDASYGQGQPKVGRYLEEWHNTQNPHDGYFRVFLEGAKSRVHNLNIGEGGEGDAWAYEVADSTVAGDIFCQQDNGSNNQSCDTSLPDPDPQGFPISGGNIAQWKAEAEAGGTIEGNHVAGNGEELGPVKINGNLTLDGNQSSLVLTGTVWVTGNITIPNGGQIALDSGYGPGSGLLMADGYVHLANNVGFQGSGHESSFVMLLTTSGCPGVGVCGGGQAISVRNNVGAVILNAQNGTIHFNNNSGAMEATANRIVMENNAVVEYQSGLASVNFVSGPTGGYEIVEWTEIE